MKKIKNALWRPAVILLLMLAVLLPAVSCSPEGGETTLPNEEPNETGDPNGNGEEEPDPPDYRALTVNELGEIMILMYHEVGEPEAEWCRSPENFRKDLETLYAEGYRLISMNDFIDGHIDIPAGTSPVILVFDDANAGNFRYLEKNGEWVIDPDCAVAIMEEFYAQHPDFGLAATFYIYGENPFRQYDLVQKKLQYLVEKGFEIGNHTYSHSNLRTASPEEARRELALNVKRITEWLPGYRVRSLALPYGEPYGGVPPEMDYLIRGSYEGVEYYNETVLLVGANPSPSPFHRDFNPAGVPRVRASEMNTAGVGMYDWLQVLRGTPGRRYISDGNPATVVVPKNLEDRVREDALQGKKLVTYQADQAE